MGRIGPEILGRLFDEHAAALVLFARPWCDAPEDIVQDAFVALARQDPAPDRAVAWLYRVVRNGAIAASRRSRRRRRREQRAADRESVARRAVVRRHRRPDRRRARRPAPRRAGRRDPRDHRRPALGRPDLRGGRPAPGLFADDRPPPIPGRARPAAREARIAMHADRDERERDSSGPDLTALERRLAAWRPAAGALDRDRMLYDAGRAAAAGPSLAAGDRRAPARDRWAWAACWSTSESSSSANSPSWRRSGRIGSRPRRPSPPGSGHRGPRPQSPLGPVHPGDRAPLAGQLPRADVAAGAGRRRSTVARRSVASPPRSGRRPAQRSRRPDPVPLRPIDIQRVLDL